MRHRDKRLPPCVYGWRWLSAIKEAHEAKGQDRAISFHRFPPGAAINAACSWRKAATARWASVAVS